MTTSPRTSTMPTSRSAERTAGAIGVIVCLLLAGCTPAEPIVAEITTDVDAIEYWLDVARTEDASQHQIDVMERAIERGTALRSDVNEMLPEYYDCLDATGLTYYVSEAAVVTGSGISIPDVSVVMPSNDEKEQDRLGAIVDVCGTRHESWIATAYANQPSSLAVNDVAWLGEALRNCLTARGYILDVDATAAEVKAVWDVAVLDGDPDGPC